MEHRAGLLRLPSGCGLFLPSNTVCAIVKTSYAAHRVPRWGDEQRRPLVNGGRPSGTCIRVTPAAPLRRPQTESRKNTKTHSSAPSICLFLVTIDSRWPTANVRSDVIPSYTPTPSPWLNQSVHLRMKKEEGRANRKRRQFTLKPGWSH